MTYQFPSNTPALTFPVLWPRAYAHQRRHFAVTSMAISRTVQVPHGWGAPGPGDLGDAVLPREIRDLSGQWVGIRLRGAMIAVIGPEWVAFPVHELRDPFVTAWLAKVVIDNEISSGIYLRPGGYFISPGTSCPVEGKAYKVASRLDQPEDLYLGTGHWRALLLGEQIR